MTFVKSLKARKVLNSRIEWTVEVEVDGAVGISPSGASKGSLEAVELPAAKAVANVNKSIRGRVEGKSFSQESLDALLQGLAGENFSRLGGNASTAVSFAFFNREFSLNGKELDLSTFPYPLGNVFGGKSHGGFSDVQEFLVAPLKAKSLPEAIEANALFYKRFRERLKGKILGVNDEGALVGRLSILQALEEMEKVSREVPVRIGLDVAASALWNGKNYEYEFEGNKLSPGEQVDFMASLAKGFKLFYLEDPLHEEDFGGFAELARKLKGKALVCGDDLTVSSRERVEMAAECKAVNSVIIKPNQVGTITLARQGLESAVERGILPVVSHRSGETEDVTVSRLAVLWKAPLAKLGVYGSRVVKLNELLRLWEKAERPKMARL